MLSGIAAECRESIGYGGRISNNSKQAAVVLPHLSKEQPRSRSMYDSMQFSWLNEQKVRKNFDDCQTLHLSLHG